MNTHDLLMPKLARREHASGWLGLRLIVLLLIGLMLIGSRPARAALNDYTIDPVHSRVLFSVMHAGFSHALGTLSAPRGELRFDPEDWRSAQVEVDIDLASLDLGDPGWNERIRKDDFLDADTHPVARFVSQRIEPIDADNARVHGELSLRGQTYPVMLTVRFNSVAAHPLTRRRTAGFSAVATLSRSALGMTAWSRVIGDKVELRIEVEAQRTPKQRRVPLR